MSGEDWQYGLKVAVIREWWTFVCKLLGHNRRPYVSSVGWKGVTLCTRCGAFNKFSEWT